MTRSEERRWETARERTRSREITEYMAETIMRNRYDPRSFGYTIEDFEEAIERYGLRRRAA